MSDDYRWLAPIYTTLSRLFFWGAREQATRWALDRKFEGKIIVIGGGDGIALSSRLQNRKGEFWETSQSMLHLAKHHLRQSKLSFHLGQFEGNVKAEVVLLPFVLDTLSDSDFEELLIKIKKSVLENGEIRVVDFYPTGSVFHRWVLNLLIKFHQIFTSHRRSDLPDYDRILTDFGFVCVAKKCWWKGFICAKIYRFSDLEP